MYRLEMEIGLLEHHVSSLFVSPADPCNK